MSASKRKGTGWESAVAAYLRGQGARHVERRTLNGAKDRGDIAGLPGVVIEAKCAVRVELAAWLDEAIRERDNDGADLGVVWFKRRGHTSPGAGFVLLDGDTFVGLLRAAGYIASESPGGGAGSSPAALRDQPTKGMSDGTVPTAGQPNRPALYVEGRA